MTKKRIAFIGVGIFGIGGQNPSMPSLVMLLNNLSSVFDLTVYRLSKGEIQKQKFKVRSLPFSFLGERINFLFILLLFSIDHFRKRYAVINALSVLPAGRIAVLLGKFFKVPVVLHLYAAEAIAMDKFNYGDIRAKKTRRLTQRICDDAAAITVLSSFHRKAIQSNLTYSCPIEVINLGCDTELFSFSDKMISNPLRILFIGYDEPVKNPVAALRVFSLIAENINATLTMVGKGLTAKRFESENISTRNVTFLESINHSELRDFFHSHDVLLITSFFESLSVVAIEAMSSGVLVCGTDVGILADLSGVASLTVAVGEEELLAKKIIALSHDLELQKKLRFAGREWAEKHDHRWTAKKYSELFDAY